MRKLKVMEKLVALPRVRLAYIGNFGESVDCPGCCAALAYRCDSLLSPGCPPLRPRVWASL
jgi:hypothetical protein